MDYSYSGAPLLPPRNGLTVIIPPQPRNPLLVNQPSDDDYERLVDVLIDCIPRFKTGELKGFIKSPMEHIIERLEKIPTLQKVEGFVGSKELDQPLEGVLIEIRGPGETETVRMAKSNQQGRFRFGRVPDGAYTIKLTLNGFRSVVGAIAVQRSLKSSEAGEP